MTATQIMRDSTEASEIPIEGTEIAAGYLDGSFQTWAALAARFPNIPRVAVDVNGSAPGAQVRDWETGDKAGSLEQWVIQHNALSSAKDAVVYCNRSTIAEVRQLTGSQVLGVDYFLWIATLDGSVFGPSDLPGVIACQDKGSAQVGANFDESIVWPTAAVWWTSGQFPTVPASPPSTPTLPANWVYPVVRDLALVNVGPSSVKLSWDAPSQPVNEAPLPGIAGYQVGITLDGSGVNLPSYSRFTVKGTNPEVHQYGSLPKATQLMVWVRAVAPDGGHAGPWAKLSFKTTA